MSEPPVPSRFPPHPPDRKSLTVKLDRDVRDFLEAVARKRGEPLAAIVRVALREWCQPVPPIVRGTERRRR